MKVYLGCASQSLMQITITMDSLSNNSVSKNEKLCYVRYEKPLKNHPLEVAKKYVETYSLSNAAAHDPEERVQLNKPKHYTIYKTKQEKKGKCKRKTSGEDD